MRQLGIDTRSYEERLIEELKQEEEQKSAVTSSGIALRQGQ